MVLDLAEGVTFADLGSRYVFLDLKRDRYFALPGRLDEQLRAAMASADDVDTDFPPFRALLKYGLVRVRRAQGGGTLRSCANPAKSSSLFDDISTRGRQFPTLAPAMALLRAHLKLKSVGLHECLSSLNAIRRNVLPQRQASEAKVLQIAQDHHRFHLFLGRTDKCLPRSIALADSLFRHGTAANLVVGVSMRPFAAHAWVQYDCIVLNDHLEHARRFTPILVI